MYCVILYENEDPAVLKEDTNGRVWLYISADGKDRWVSTLYGYKTGQFLKYASLDELLVADVLDEIHTKAILRLEI